MPLDSVTHASVLKAAGYTTAYFGKWHCGQQKERPGFDRAELARGCEQASVGGDDRQVFTLGQRKVEAVVNRMVLQQC